MSEEGISLRAVVEALDEPALIIQGLTVSFANDEAKAIFGNEIEGRDVRLAIRHPAALEHILAGRAGEIDVTGIGAVGRPWRLVVSDLGRDVVFVRIIDRAAAVAAERMRVDFVANASHELRTPLSALIGYAETLADDSELSPELRGKFSRTIRDEATRMLRIIEDLMSLSRIQADRFVEPSERIDVGEILQCSAATARRPTANGRNCTIKLHISADLPAVKGDRGQLSQVFDNLLSNALRYGCEQPDSGVEVTASSDERFVTATVTDQGAGIARQHIPRLTERFYRVDEARSRATGGTGLGLAIVKHIVERHRGSLEIKSEPGMGTSVSVRLPVCRSPL